MEKVVKRRVFAFPRRGGGSERIGRAVAELGRRPVVKIGWWPQAEEFWSIWGPGEVFLI